MAKNSAQPQVHVSMPMTMKMRSELAIQRSTVGYARTTKSSLPNTEIPGPFSPPCCAVAVETAQSSPSNEGTSPTPQLPQLSRGVTSIARDLVTRLFVLRVHARRRGGGQTIGDEAGLLTLIGNCRVATERHSRAETGALPVRN
eukprot:scaffold237428_cov30-Tisochrysis_lutea.AAC.1